MKPVPAVLAADTNGHNLQLLGHVLDRAGSWGGFVKTLTVIKLVGAVQKVLESRS